MKHKSKLTTAVILVALLLGMIAGTVYAATEWIDYFTRSDSSTIGNGWVEYETSGNDVVIDDNEMEFLTDGDELGILVYKEFTEIDSGDVEAEFNVDLNRTGSEGTYYFHAQIGDSDLFSNTNEANGVAADLVWRRYNGDEKFVVYDGTTITELCQADGANIEVRIVADMDTEEWYVDVLDTTTGNPPSHCTLDNLAFRKSNLTNIDAIRFIADDMRPTHFDDIIVDPVWVGTNP